MGWCKKLIKSIFKNLMPEDPNILDEALKHVVFATEMFKIKLVGWLQLSVVSSAAENAVSVHPLR